MLKQGQILLANEVINIFIKIYIPIVKAGRMKAIFTLP